MSPYYKSGDSKRTANLHIRLTPEQYESVYNLAKKYKTTVTKLVIQALEEFKEAHK